MKKWLILFVIFTMVLLPSALFANGQKESGSSSSTAQNTMTASGDTGFAANAVVGVSLPWLGTQNWAEANTMFKTQLQAAGFKPIVLQADQKVPQQQQQIESLIQNVAKAIVVGPIDGTQLGTVLKEAKDAGVYIIGYDRLIENTTDVDGVVQFGSIKTGEQQGQALLDGLAAWKGKGPYNIELFGGGPADPNAPNFFKGAMKVLQPKIDDGTLVIVSGQKDFTQCATLNWDNSKAQTRMDSLLSGFYANKEIDGVLCPNDGIARAVITSCLQAGQKTPVTSGLDSENETVKWIWEGKQYSTVYKPTNVLVSAAIKIIESLQAGKGMPTPTSTVNNGKKMVNLYELPSVVVTKQNEKQVFANDAGRMKLLQ
jgi:putative multiple sugar transport system substrate-binding protein